MPDLVTPEEEMSPVPDHSNDSGYGTQDTTLLMSMQTKTVSNTRTDRRPWPKPLEKDLSNAPWQKESAKGPLEDLEKIHLWWILAWQRPGHNQQTRPGSQKAQGKESSPASGQQRWHSHSWHLQLRQKLLPLQWAHRTPCPTMHQGNPAGHPKGCHSQHSSWTLDRSSKDCPPIILKLAHKPCCPLPQEFQPTSQWSWIQLPRCIQVPHPRKPRWWLQWQLSQEYCWRSCPQKKSKVIPTQLNLDPPKKLKYNQDIQVCSALLTLFSYKRHIYRPSEEILPVPVWPPDDPSKAMDMPRTKCRHGG